MPWLWWALKKLRSDWFSYESTEHDFVPIGRPAVPKLVEVLDERTEEHPNRQVMDYARRKALNAIEKIGEPRAVPALIRALSDTDPWIVGSAAEALRQFETSQAIAAVAHLDRQQEQDRQKQIYFVHNIRSKYGRWRVDVIPVSPYQSGMPD